MNILLAILALLSLALVLWQWLAACRFPLHRRVEDKSFAPGVTLLKPLKGCDAETKKCLRSWLAQDYAGPVQILFGVASETDPVCEIVRQLLEEFPQQDAQLVICPETLGTNLKVSKLVQLERRAAHELIVISDADVCVPADFLANAVGPLRDNGRAGSPSAFAASQSAAPARRLLPTVAGDDEGGAHGVTRPTVGLVNCFYRLANPGTTALRWEAVAINADFWSMVLQSRTLAPLDFALGAAMVMRRKSLAAIGGFTAIVDCLADDYQLGHRIARLGHRIELSPVVVECWSSPMDWRAVWRHQLRWARTIRVCKPASYFFSILSNGTLWPLLWWALQPSYLAALTFCFCLIVRTFTALHLQWKLNRSATGDRDWWLVPVKDLLQVALWAGAFCGRGIEWRGERYRLRKDGTMEKG